MPSDRSPQNKRCTNRPQMARPPLQSEPFWDVSARRPHCESKGDHGARALLKPLWLPCCLTRLASVRTRHCMGSRTPLWPAHPLQIAMCRAAAATRSELPPLLSFCAVEQTNYGRCLNRAHRTNVRYAVGPMRPWVRRTRWEAEHGKLATAHAFIKAMQHPNGSGPISHRRAKPMARVMRNATTRA